MPFANFKNFQECIDKTMKAKGWGKERASAYCAYVERTINKRRKAKGENPPSQVPHQVWGEIRSYNHTFIPEPNLG